MPRGSLGALMNILMIGVTLFGLAASQKARARARQDARRPFSLSPSGQEQAAGNNHNLPPTNWPDWTASKIHVSHHADDDMDEGISSDQPPTGSEAVVSSPQSVSPFDMPVHDEEEQVTSELIKGIIWSEILQPPLALRNRRGG